MLTKKPERGLAPTKGKRGKRRVGRRADWDPIAEAFRDHGIDPNEPDAQERLLKAMALERYPERGRPRGSSKWDLRRRAQLLCDVILIQDDHGVFSPGEMRRSNKQIAELLKVRHPDRYATESTSWLRQCVSMVTHVGSDEDVRAVLDLLTGGTIKSPPHTPPWLVKESRSWCLPQSVINDFPRVFEHYMVWKELISLLPRNEQLDMEDTKRLREWFERVAVVHYPGPGRSWRFQPWRGETHETQVETSKHLLLRPLRSQPCP